MVFSVVRASQVSQVCLGGGEEKNFSEISEVVGNGVLIHRAFLLLQPKEKGIRVVGKTQETCHYLLNFPLLCKLKNDMQAAGAAII